MTDPRDVLAELEAVLDDDCGCHVADALRRAIDEIKRLRFSETMQAKLIGTWIDAHDAVVRRLSRWRALARKRREQVQNTRDDWQADLEAAATEIEKLKQVIGSVGGEEHRAKKALREVSAALDSRTAEVEALKDQVERYQCDWEEWLSNKEESRSVRLTAERDAALAEVEALKARLDDSREYEIQLTRCWTDAAQDLADAIKERDEARTGQYTKDLCDAVTTARNERDRARELLKSTEAMVNEHLQARLRAEDLETEAVRRAERAEADLYLSLEDERAWFERARDLREEVDRLISTVCAANLELGWARLRAEALEAELDGYRGAY